MLKIRQLPDEDAREVLMKFRGIGRWTAEVFLMCAQSRPDIWPANDLALQTAVCRLLELATHPSTIEMDVFGEKWRPHRSSAAILLWYHYNKILK